MFSVREPALVSTRREYDHLFSIYVPIGIGVFAVIVFVVAFALIRYRGRAPEQAGRWHEDNPLEGGYALLLTLTVAFLLYLTFTAEHRVDTVANQQRPAVTIDVTGAKWEWTFFYPASGITMRSGTVGHQPLVVPTGVPVRFDLRTLDVIHAFWIPHTNYKHDLIPGSTQVATLALDLHQPCHFRWWILDFLSPRLLRWLQRTWDRQLASGGARFQFGPPQGLAFFEPYGWRVAESRPAMAESHRLRREGAFARLWSALLPVLPCRLRRAYQRMAGYGLLER